MVSTTDMGSGEVLTWRNLGKSSSLYTASEYGASTMQKTRHARSDLNMSRDVREVKLVPDEGRVDLAEAVPRTLVQHVRQRRGVQLHAIRLPLEQRAVHKVHGPDEDRRRGVRVEEVGHGAHGLREPLEHGVQLRAARLEPLDELGERAGVDLEVVDAEGEEGEERDVHLRVGVGVRERGRRHADAGDNVATYAVRRDVAKVPGRDGRADARRDVVVRDAVRGGHRQACPAEELCYSVARQRELVGGKMTISARTRSRHQMSYHRVIPSLNMGLVLVVHHHFGAKLVRSGIRDGATHVYLAQSMATTQGTEAQTLV